MAAHFKMRMATLSVSDLGLISVILHEHGKLLGIDRSKKRVEFIFEDTPELQEIVRQFFSNELLCPAQSLLLSFRRAKQILHDYSIPNPGHRERAPP